MRRILLLRAIALSLTFLFHPFARAQEIAGVRQMFDGTMLPGEEVLTFEHSDKLFPVNRVLRGSNVHPLPAASRPLTNVHFQSRGMDYDLFDYLADNRVAGLLVLKDGKVAFEHYELGTDAATRWVSFSMAKSVASTLVGAALKQGLIRSLDDPLVKYLPQLKSGPYADVSVRNIMQMASGVKWDETYTDPHSNRRQLLDRQLEQKPGSILAYMNTLKKAGAPGTIWNYSTGESFLVGALLEAATHESLAAYCTEVLWSRLGMEQDATWWLESPGGMGLAGSGMGATLRDYGRFALLVQQDGVLDGQRIVSEGWFHEAGSPHVIGGSRVDYGYLWWPVAKGDPVHAGAFQAIGIFGQHMYINPHEKLSIVVLSARPKPDSRLSAIDDLAFFAAVAKSLQ
jgi:CubicO group peptidase (beta-lactamase class C family)